MSFLSFFGLGKRKAPWPEGIPCFYPNIADKDLIPIIPQNVLDERARWPILMILPLASRDSEVDDIALGVGLSRQLVYDLLLIPGLSIRGSHETPQVYLEAAHKQRKDRDPTIYISGTTTAGPGFTRVELSLFLPGRPVALATVIHETDFPTFYRNLFLAIAQGCGGQVDDTFVEKMLARLPTRDGLTELGRILVSYSSTSPTKEEYHQRNSAALRLFHTKTCGTLPLHLLNLFEEELRQTPPMMPIPRIWPETLQGLFAAPEDVQLLGIARRTLGYRLAYEHVVSNVKTRLVCGPEILQFDRRLLELSPGYAEGYNLSAVDVRDESCRSRFSRQAYRLQPGHLPTIHSCVINLLSIPHGQETFDFVSSLIDEAMGLIALKENQIDQLQEKHTWLVTKFMMLRLHNRQKEMALVLQESETIEAKIAELSPEIAARLIPLTDYPK
ncbi:MAG: hypothetical protein ACO1RA_05455 [Planctomycetaceae bacterium]